MLSRASRQRAPRPQLVGREGFTREYRRFIVDGSTGTASAAAGPSRPRGFWPGPVEGPMSYRGRGQVLLRELLGDMRDETGS